MVSTLVALAPYVVNLPETSKKSPTTTGCPTHEQGIYGACNESSDPSALPSQCKSSTPSVTTDTRADPQAATQRLGEPIERYSLAVIDVLASLLILLNRPQRDARFLRQRHLRKTPLLAPRFQRSAPPGHTLFDHFDEFLLGCFVKWPV